MDSLKILVVDDEVPIRELLKRGLSQLGNFSVEIAGNGSEAVEKIEKDLFDLLKLPLDWRHLLPIFNLVSGQNPQSLRQDFANPIH